MREIMTSRGLLLNVRRYEPRDALQAAMLFEQSVRLGAVSYDADQRAIWASAAGSRELWQDMLPALYTLVAEDGGGMAGFAALDEAECFVDMIYVRPDVMGQGVAHALYGLIEQHARETGIVELGARASRHGAPFFTRQGWRIVRESSVCREGVNLPCFEMRKSLEG